MYYDPEVPAGYQDADLETLELEELAAADYRERIRRGPQPDPAAELVLELPDGQQTLAVPVEERNGQQVMMELAPPPKPAPLTFERDAAEKAAREELAELEEKLRRESEERVPAWTPEELETLEELGADPELELEEPRTVDVDAGLVVGTPQTMTRAELMETLAAPKPRGAPYRCAKCGAELEEEHYVFSTHTRARYCWPGEGCNHHTKED